MRRFYTLVRRHYMRSDFTYTLHIHTQRDGKVRLRNSVRRTFIHPPRTRILFSLSLSLSICLGRDYDCTQNIYRLHSITNKNVILNLFFFLKCVYTQTIHTRECYNINIFTELDFFFFYLTASIGNPVKHNKR